MSSKKLMPKIMVIGLILALLFSINFAIGFSYGTVYGGIGESGNNGQNNTGPYLPPPSFNFTQIKIPNFPSIQWTLNVISDFEQLVQAVPDYIAGFVGAILADAFLYLIEALYYFFAYIEYYMLNFALTTAYGLGIWALPVFVGILLIIGSIVVMILKILPDALLIGG